MHSADKLGSEQTYAPLGTLLFALPGSLLSTLFMMFGYAGNFFLSVSMKYTRKAFFFSCLAAEFLYITLYITIAIAFYKLELFLYGSLLYPTMPNEWNFEATLPFSPLLLIPPAAFALSSLCLFLGSGYYRLGNTFICMLGFVWFFCFFLLPSAGNKSNSAFGQFLKPILVGIAPVRISLSLGVALLLGLSTAMSVISYVFMRRQDLHN